MKSVERLTILFACAKRKIPDCAQFDPVPKEVLNILKVVGRILLSIFTGRATVGFGGLGKRLIGCLLLTNSAACSGIKGVRRS